MWQHQVEIKSPKGFFNKERLDMWLKASKLGLVDYVLIISSAKGLFLRPFSARVRRPDLDIITINAFFV